jgi:hypothetical protein
MIRYSFNSQIKPPAPFVNVVLRHPLSGEEIRDVPAQLDTAADRTLLPMALVKSLELPAIGSIGMGGVGGMVIQMTLFVVLLGIHTLPL